MTDDPLPQIMNRLRADLGRTPPASEVTKLEDYAPKSKEPSGAALMKLGHLVEGLRDMLMELENIRNVLHGNPPTEANPAPAPAGLLDKLDVSARYLAGASQCIGDIKDIIL